MAKDKTEAATTETAAATGAGGRAVTLTVDGKEVRRVDYIRDLWASGKFSRGEIRKKLKEEHNHEVPYQIIFQATKGKEGGPAPKVEETPAAA